jgi:hypothetical protein
MDHQGTPERALGAQAQQQLDLGALLHTTPLYAKQQLDR